MTRFTTSAFADTAMGARREKQAMVAVGLLVFCLGCKSDLSQQLLERELRMQEDQIYQLQDELQDKCARLERVAGENGSLRKQLGFSDADGPTGRRGPGMPGMPALPGMPGGQTSPATRSGPGQPTLVPPTIQIPGAPSGAGGSAPPPGALPLPGTIAPPKLDGIPPLPTEPRFPGARSAERSTVTPASATSDVVADLPAASPSAELPTGRPLSREESLADAGKITHIYVNAARTECFDGDGDGISDGLAIVVEPRDGDERLVTAAGDVSISVFDPAGPTGAAALARWDIPAGEAIGHFRRTSRNRGLHFVLRWPGPPPRGEHVRVQVSLITFEAAAFETDCTVAAKPGQQRHEPR